MLKLVVWDSSSGLHIVGICSVTRTTLPSICHFNRDVHLFRFILSRVLSFEFFVFGYLFSAWASSAPFFWRLWSANILPFNILPCNSYIIFIFCCWGHSYSGFNVTSSGAHSCLTVGREPPSDSNSMLENHQVPNQ